MTWSIKWIPNSTWHVQVLKKYYTFFFLPVNTPQLVFQLPLQSGMSMRVECEVNWYVSLTGLTHKYLQSMILIHFPVSWLKRDHPKDLEQRTTRADGPQMKGAWIHEWMYGVRAPPKQPHWTIIISGRNRGILYYTWNILLLLL